MDGLASSRYLSLSGASLSIRVALSRRTPPVNSQFLPFFRLPLQLAVWLCSKWLVDSRPAESCRTLRRWVWRLLFPRSWSLELIFHLSFWRRHHQALARYHHYRKRSQAP
jgi:hypothetical protein